LLQTARPDALPMRPAVETVAVRPVEQGSAFPVAALISGVVHLALLAWAAHVLPNAAARVQIDPRDLVQVVSADVALPKPERADPPPPPEPPPAAVIPPPAPTPEPVAPKRKTRKRRPKPTPAAPAPFEQEQAAPTQQAAEAPPTSVPAMPLAAGAGSVEVPVAPPAGGDAAEDEPTRPDALPGDGSGEEDGVLLGRYGKGLRRSVARQQRYPGEAMDEGWTGVVEVEVRIARDGSLASDPVVRRSSGHAVLDREACRMVRAAAPFTALPAGLSVDVATIVLPIVFELEDEDF
jgi:protein TonB